MAKRKVTVPYYDDIRHDGPVAARRLKAYHKSQNKRAMQRNAMKLDNRLDREAQNRRIREGIEFQRRIMYAIRMKPRTINALVEATGFRREAIELFIEMQCNRRAVVWTKEGKLVIASKNVVLEQRPACIGKRRSKSRLRDRIL